MESHPDEIRVLGLQPITASAVPIEAALPLRHYAFEAQLARLGEHHRALGGERFAEQNSAGAAGEPLKSLAPLLDRPLAQIIPIRRRRSKATSEACAPPRFVMSAPKSLGPSSRGTTAPPSISASPQRGREPYRRSAKSDR
jgi:hypothetical protein